MLNTEGLFRRRCTHVFERKQQHEGRSSRYLRNDSRFFDQNTCSGKAAAACFLEADPVFFDGPRRVHMKMLCYCREFLARPNPQVSSPPPCPSVPLPPCPCPCPCTSLPTHLSLPSNCILVSVGNQTDFVKFSNHRWGKGFCMTEFFQIEGQF